MTKTKNKKSQDALVRHFRSNWGNLAEFLDKVALEAYRGAPYNCPAFELGNRLREVAHFARDPYKCHNHKTK